MNRAHTTLAALLAVAGSGSLSLGAVKQINPGQTVALDGITSAEDTSLPAVILHDWEQEFSISNATGVLFRATLQSRVARRLDNDQLDFNWRIHDIEVAQGQVSSFVVTGFDGFLQGVEYRPDGSGSIAPSHASLSGDGSALGFLFAGPTLTDPDGSKFTLARTDAYDFSTLGTVRINLLSGEFVTLTTYAPAVPAPGGAALLAGLGLVGSRRRRA